MRDTLSLYAVVFIGGASVLSLEILGTRILGPFYGVSLFLWSALITVTLLALSVGYLLGGRWADRGPRLSRLGLILAAAGLWTVAIPWLRDPVLGAVQPLGLRGAVLAAAFALFVPPLTLLGMIGPYAIRLRAHELRDVGRTAGDIYAVSTIASVAAALATGFFLIPVMGVQRMTLLLGGVMMLASLLTLGRGGGARGTLGRGGGTRGTLGLVALTLLLGGWQLRPAATALPPGVLVQVQSPYGEIRVAEKGSERFLLIDGGMHTRILQDTYQPLFRYVVAMDALKLCFEKPGRVLMVGLGGGTLAREFARSHWDVDAVEIDPVVAELAASYFDLRPEHARVHVMDGRAFFRNNPGTWNLIVLDAFGSSAIPFHLITREFFTVAREHLAPGGMLAINIIASAWDDPLVRAVTATLKAAGFPHVSALPTQEPPDAVGNVVLVGSDQDLETRDLELPHPMEYLGDDYQHWVVVQLNHAWDNRFAGPDGGQVLTDDRNPVEVWSEDIHREVRREALEFFARDKSDWSRTD